MAQKHGSPTFLAIFSQCCGVVSHDESVQFERKKQRKGILKPMNLRPTRLPVCLLHFRYKKFQKMSQSSKLRIQNNEKSLMGIRNTVRLADIPYLDASQRPAMFVKKTVYRIGDVMIRIRICGSVPIDFTFRFGSGSRSCSFL